jgi:hypothetical protein
VQDCGALVGNDPIQDLVINRAACKKSRRFVAKSSLVQEDLLGARKKPMLVKDFRKAI